MFNITTYGAVGNGTTNDQPSIQAAINAAIAAGGGEVYFPKPPKSYRINSRCFLSNAGVGGHHISLRGDGPSSVIKIENADSTAFDLNLASQKVEISRLQIINGAMTPSSGYAVNLTIGGSLWVNIHDIIIESLYGAVGSTAATTGPLNNNVLITNCLAIDIKGTGFLLQAALDWVITSSLVQIKSTTSGRGLVLETNSEGLYATNSLFLGGQYAIMLNHGGSGSPPKQHNFLQVAGDGAGSASWQINACKRCRMVNCWAASVQNLARGVVINNTGGNTSGIVWDGGILLNCGAEAVQINGGTKIFIQGAHILSNSLSVRNTYAGIAVAANLSDFVIRDCQIYNDTDSLLPGRQKHGIQVNTGGSDNYMIINNYLRGNETSGLADGGSGANKVVCNNIL